LQKLGYLPEDRTDFLFAVICEELGIAGAVLVVALYLGLMWAGLSIVRREPLMSLKLAGLGVLLTVGLQAIMNLFVVTGMGPTKGIALPMLSSGGTGWLLTAASLGLLVGMDRCASREGRANTAALESEEAEAFGDDADGEFDDGLDEGDEEDAVETPEIVVPALPIRGLHTR
jgi:cell division protein FtsW